MGRAQGLNFNYFLFGRYNISMLGCKASERRDSPLSPATSLSSNVIIIITCMPRYGHFSFSLLPFSFLHLDVFLPFRGKSRRMHCAIKILQLSSSQDRIGYRSSQFRIIHSIIFKISYF